MPWVPSWTIVNTDAVNGDPALITVDTSVTFAAGDGEKYVYAMYMGEMVNFKLNNPVSPVYSDSTILDTTGPTVTDNASAHWKRTAATVTLSPVDGGSGVAKTQYQDLTTGSSTWLDTTANQFIVAAPPTIPTTALTATCTRPSTTPVTSAPLAPAR